MSAETPQRTDGITLLGAEMLTWSDFDGEVGAFGGLLAASLLSAAAGSGRVLIAGPTSVAVIHDVAARYAGADVLVRSWPDAQQLRAALPESVGVFCGPLDRMVRTGVGYDAVLAVAGTDRLHTAEEETPTLAAVLADLVALVAEDGELYLGVGNPVGVDRLLSLGSTSRHHDADWPAGHVPDGDPELGAEEVAGLLVDVHGMARVETWFCHGRRADPLVAAPAMTLVGRASDPVPLREVGRAYDVVDPSAPALKDPAGTVRDLVRAGLGAATAPLVVLHLRRGQEQGRSAPLDELLVCEPVHDGSPAVGYRLTPGPSGWQRSLLGEPASYAAAAGVHRETAALVGPVPDGGTLAVAIEACCAAHDATAAGALVRQYRDWLGAGGDSVTEDRVPMLPRSMAVTSAGLVPLDTSWAAYETAPRDVVLVRGLLDLAADLLARGVRHPWSPAASARAVTISLAAAAGIEEDDLPLEAALALDARLRPAGTAPDYEAPANAGRLSYAELVELAEGLAKHAADGDDHVLWLLQRLQGRQRALRHTRANVEALERSREMWIGRRVLALRSLVRRWRRRRDERLSGPKGEWRDTSADAPPPEEPITIESDLLPPGYQPPAEITVVPPED